VRTDELLLALEQSALADALKHSFIVYPLVNALHIIGLALLFGAIAALDLKLLGAFPRAPLGPLTSVLVPVSATGLVIAVAAGLLLFSVRAMDYAANPAFLTKIALVALGTTNALLLRRGRAWHDALDGFHVPSRIRLSAALSLATWSAAIVCGRLIGFLD